MSYNTKNIICSPQYLTKKQSKKTLLSLFFFNTAMLIKKSIKHKLSALEEVFRATFDIVKIMQKSEYICMESHKFIYLLLVGRLNSKKHLSC